MGQCPERQVDGGGERCLSADTRFVLAYDAARTLSLIVVRAAGYRPRSAGGHYNTFLALGAADQAFDALSVYFDGCRMKRNNCEYDFAGGVSDTERPTYYLFPCARLGRAVH